MHDRSTADSAARPVVLVTGATGGQGRSVTWHLLAGGHFGVRALTRSPNSPAADTLRAPGAEIVTGDPGDHRSLRVAITGRRREVADTFDYYRVYVPSRRDDIFVGRLRYPALQRFETWAARHAAQLAEAPAA